MKTLKFVVFPILIAISTVAVYAQEPLFPIGRKWIVLCEYVNPHIDSDVLEYRTIKHDTINEKCYSSINLFAELYRKVGCKILTKTPNNDSENLIFNESWEVGDTTTWIQEDVYDVDSMKFVKKYETIVKTGYINGLKYWDLNINGWESTWLQGVGYIKGGRTILEECNWRIGGPSETVICCVEANGDTLYVNRDILHLIQTSVNNLSADNISVTPADDGCFVTLGSDAVEWTATLYNSNGVTVAQQQGNGSEIFLPTDSKGTHILVVKAGGRVVKKKIMLR